MTRVVALTTCHNRCAKTLRAVTRLHDWFTSLDADTRIVVVDDGCQDGTAESILDRCPDVEIVEGNGELFWAGGMSHGWNQAIGPDLPDYLIVFNDDVDLDPIGMAEAWVAAQGLASNGDMAAFVLTGACRVRENGPASYGGAARSSRWHPLRFQVIEPNGELQACDTCNMNFAIISRAALQRIGFLDPNYVHTRADFDFGLRLRRADGDVLLTAGYVGVCPRNDIAGTSADSSLGVWQRWRRLLSIREHEPRQRAIYCRRHAGLFWPIFWVLPYVSFWMRGGRSRSS